MYSKYSTLSPSLLTSSIWEADTPTRIVWITMLAAMDEDGFCAFACIANLANRARVSPEAAQHAVDLLSSPDPNSSDPDNEGRRIERVQGGWIVLNARKYSERARIERRREQSRERARRFRERKRNEQSSQEAGNVMD